MTFIAPWRKNRRKVQNDETELQGDQILSAMMSDHGQTTPVPSGHEEKAKQSLESIYTLETIDVQTVKPLLKTSQQPQSVPTTSDPQLSLPMNESSDPFDLSVIPWMERRGGIATRFEIEERLERTHCSSPSFSSSLITLEEHLFASSLESEKRFNEVITRAKTYFYSPRITYPMSTLIDWLVREFAKEWTEMTPAFIEKCLSTSTQFVRFKTPNHQLSIRI